MTCTQLREVLNGYVDGELSPDTVVVVDAHVRQCPSCARAVEHMNVLRRHVRQVVTAVVPPRDLEPRIRQSLKPRWAAAFSPVLLGSAAALVLLLAGFSTGMVRGRGLKVAVTEAFGHVLVQVASTEQVQLSGTILCRDCELHRRYGEPRMCDRIGHHGAVATSDGRLWNIVEQPSSARLIHDSDLLGRKVHVRGKLFRDAGSIAIESYELTDVGRAPIS